MVAKYTFKLSVQERQLLSDMVRKGKTAARKRIHAHILLLCDGNEDVPKRTDADVAQVLGIGICTVYRVKQRFVMEGIDSALNPRTQSRRRELRLDGKAEAQLTMLACSKPPEGCKGWTLQLLADRLVELQVVDSVCRATICRTLKKTS